MSAFNIQSEENTLDLPLVIDIEGAGAKSVEHGAALLTNNPSGMPSQFWTKVPATSSPGWFTIRSNLVDKDSGAPLVIDIRNPDAITNPITRGRQLDVWTARMAATTSYGNSPGNSSRACLLF